MSRTNGKLFDNVGVCTRRAGCAVFSVQPPFTLACWPELRTVLSELGLHEVWLRRPQDQVRFLTALAEHSGGARNFRPARVGFESSRNALRRREAFRQNYRRVVFLGKCSRQIALAAIELAATQVQVGGTIDIQVKGWDLLADWGAGSERLRDWCNYLALARRRRATVTVFSEFQELPGELWKLVYDCPNVRLAWRADALAGLSKMEGFRAYWEASPAARNLRALAEAGIWPHIILPVTKANSGILDQLVTALLEETRGASIELVPLPLLPMAALQGACSSRREEALNNAERGARSAEFDQSLLTSAATMNALNPTNAAAPAAGQYVKALLAVCRDPRIPRQLIAPLSWVAARMNSQATMISSPVAAGVELAVLADGEMYAGECAAGVGRWRLGNVVDDPASLRWERLDALPEMFSTANMPAQCQACDWRYRCGGADASVFLLQETLAERNATPTGAVAAGKMPAATFDALFELYCAPRKALFEEMLWGSVDAGLAGKDRPGRETLELQADGIIFRPAPAPGQEMSKQVLTQRRRDRRETQSQAPEPLSAPSLRNSALSASPR
jgi:radical SAM protein with 4Fe4S-binding SPASM domain